MTDKTNDVERLAWDVLEDDGAHRARIGIFRNYAYSVIHVLGYVHKSRAVDLCMKCETCNGRGWDIVKPISKTDRSVDCPYCKGKGIVFKAEDGK